MQIRELKLGDLDNLRELVSRVYSDSNLAMWFDKTPLDLELNALFLAKLEAVKEGSAIDMVAIENGVLIGECEIVKSIGKNIVGIIISKEYRRHGIGGKLLKRAEKKARSLKFESIGAEVAKENVPAIRFFQKFGFEIQGIADKQFTRDGKLHSIIYLEKRL